MGDISSSEKDEDEGVVPKRNISETKQSKLRFVSHANFTRVRINIKAFKVDLANSSCLVY